MKRIPLLAALLLAGVTGCGMGHFTREPAYDPASPAMKSLSTAGVGVLPIEDQRPSAAEDTKGDHVGACIMLGALYPISAHVEHIESSSCGTLTSYDSVSQEAGEKGSPLFFLRENLIKELTRANVLGPARAVDRPDAAPFTLKAVLKSTAIDARTYCYTPVDTTWIFWMLGLPYGGYDFHLALDLSLFGPDGGGKPLWTETIDAKTGGVTGFYYDTGATDENNLVKIYGDLLASRMAKSADDLQKTLQNARPDLWRRAKEFQLAAAARAAAPQQAEPAAANEGANPPAANGQAAPWWK